eukprot:4363757-Alexandrium_andersonii.AAC.1
MADAMASILVPKCGPLVAQESCHDLIRQAVQGEIERGEHSQQQDSRRVGPLVSESCLEGPTELLVATLERWELQIDQNLVIWHQERPVFNLLNCPIQRIRPILMQHHARLAAFRAQQRLPSIQGSGLPDWRRSLRVMEDLPENDRALMRRIMNNGLWTQSMLEAMQVGNDGEGGVCPWCGECQQDHAHMLWECNAFHAQREQVWGSEQLPDRRQLPQALARCGVATLMRLPKGPCSTDPFWGEGISQRAPGELFGWAPPKAEVAHFLEQKEAPWGESIN